MTVTYSSDPVVRWSNAKRCWIIVEPFTVTWTKGGKLTGNKVLYKFTVEKDFNSDGASIPRRLQGFVSKEGNHFQPSLAHDWCYEDKVPGMTQKEADDCFKDGMESIGGVPWYRRHVMYLAVRAAGRGLWG